MQLIHKYLNQKYDVKERNCYHFLIDVLEQGRVPADVPLRRFDLTQANVRKRTIVTHPLERIVDAVNRHLWTNDTSLAIIINLRMNEVQQEGGTAANLPAQKLTDVNF